MSHAVNSRVYMNEIGQLVSAYLHQFPDQASQLERLQGQLDTDDRLLSCRRNMTGHLTASAFYFDTIKGAVLLVYHNFLQCWLQPGGHLEPDEHPLDGALRELAEETGIESATAHNWHSKNRIPIDIDTHLIPPSGSKNEGEHYHHDFQYLVTASPEKPAIEVSIDKTEVSSSTWIALEQLETGDFDQRLGRVAKRVRELGIFGSSL